MVMIMVKEVSVRKREREFSSVFSIIDVIIIVYDIVI